MKLDFHNQKILQVNALPSRAYYVIENNSPVKLTSWRFAYFDGDDGSLEEVSPSFLINTPSCWEYYGFGSHQYTNIKYPFPYAPPYILKENPCGVYVTDYVVAEKSGRYYLNLDGVDSCFYAFINKKFAGYSSVSHSPAEFDITDYILVGKNEIRIIVFKYNFGSYLEDQDKFRMSGIFRDVYILNRPEGHLRDYKITTDIADGRGIISFNADRECSLTLSYNGLEIAQEEGSDAEFSVENPSLWCAENPSLYDLAIKCCGEVIIERVGIRKVEIEGKLFKLNGKPITALRKRRAI